MSKEFDIEKEISGNLKAHMGHIHACCAKFLKDPDERSLLQSEVLEKIWTKKHLFSGTEAEFRGWVFIITKNSFISKFNQKKKNPTQDIDDIWYDLNDEDSYNIEDDIDNKQKLDDIFYTIEDRFKEDYVKVFKANIIDGKKYEECVEEFGYPMYTIKHIIYTLRQYVSNPLNIISRPITKTVIIAQRPAIIRPKTRFINSIFRVVEKYNKALATIR